MHRLVCAFVVYMQKIRYSGDYLVSLKSSQLKHTTFFAKYSKTCVERPISKRLKIGFQDQLSLNSGQKYCRMLQGEHSAIPVAFIKLPIVIKTFVLSIFEWPFYTGFTLVSLTTSAHNIFCKILLNFGKKPYIS